MLRLFSIPLELYIDPEYNRKRRRNLIFIASLFESYFIYYGGDPYSYDVPNTIIEIEKSIYNKALLKVKKNRNNNFDMYYNTFSAKITKNIDISIKDIDTTLIKALIHKKMDISKIVNYKSYTLAPVKNKKTIEKIEKQISIQDEEILENTSETYKCPRCGAFSCVITTVQMRSLDEAENLSLTCTECDNRWIL